MTLRSEAKRAAVLLSLLATGAAAVLVPAAPAASTTLTVCQHGCPYTELAPALAAAHEGDTIRVGRGTYAGGVSIEVSLRLVGAGSGRTVIRGGGPVVTVRAASGSAPPSVRLARLTLTGGVSHGDGVEAYGGGLYVPPAADGSPGATVSLDRVAVSGNRTEATRTSASPSGVKCPHGDCPYAASRGGGIATFGRLSLIHSTVSGNTAAGVASDANGGGIFSAGAALTVDRSVVSGNLASALIPNGRFAEGGGVFVESGSLRVRSSHIDHNDVRLTTALPAFVAGSLVDMSANSGGIHVGSGVETTVRRTVIDGNTVKATGLTSEPVAVDSGMLVTDSHLVMSDSVVSHNRVEETAASTKHTGVEGTALEVDGPATITRTRVVDNPVVIRSPHGVAAATAGFAVYDFSHNPRQVVLRDSVVRGNTATAISATGSAEVKGVGILNNGLLRLEHVVVTDNTGQARAAHTSAQGAGIWNGPLLSGPPVTLALHHTMVTRNHLHTRLPGVRRGAGMFTTVPVTLDHSAIRGNTPDQCHGCG